LLVQDLIALALRTAGVLAVGQSALPQDTSDAQTMLTLLMQQWRQKRWLVFRLDTMLFPVTVGKATYTVGPTANTPDVVVAGNYRPANVQSCYLRQDVGSGPNSFPIDFPMTILGSRQEYDAIRLKSLASWPASIFFDPTVPNATLYIWPIPIQNFFHLYIAFQQAIDMAAEGAQSLELTSVLPAETQMALMYNLALLLNVNYKLPPDPQLMAAAKSSANTLRQTNFALKPLRMPGALLGPQRMKNPAAGFYYPEVSASIVPTSVLS